METTKGVSFFQLLPFVHLFLLAILPNATVSEPFGFLEDLKGVHNGQTAPGLHKVKNYLKRFGYLNVAGNFSDMHEYDISGNFSDVHEHDDVFDDVLEFQIKAYQLNYGLNDTGRLDAQTVKQMMMPRCGRPDVVVNTLTSMVSKKKKNTAAMIPGKWSTTHLTYRFSTNNSSGAKVDSKTLRSVVLQAFARWENVSNFKFTEETDSDIAADMVIGFRKADHSNDSIFDGPMGIVAHAYEPNDGRIYYDADDKWDTSPKTDTMDLESVATHEIGHFLGLEHIFEPNSVMYPVFSPGITKREVQENDVKALRAIYGSCSTNQC